MDISNAGERWSVTLSRTGDTPITSGAKRLPDAVAEAVNVAEALGWHRSARSTA